MIEPNSKKTNERISPKATEGTCGKKVKNLLWHLGFDESYTGSPTHAHVNRWLRDNHSFHVMPAPVASGKWKVWVILLGRPNTQDGLLNATNVDGKTFISHDVAMEAGLLFPWKSSLMQEERF